MCQGKMLQQPIISLSVILAITISGRCQAENATLSRCTVEELKQFSEEYEICHHKAYETIQSKELLTVLLKKSKIGESPKPLIASGVGETESNNALVCKALSSLINECTLVLGWCFPDERVKDTKQKQWEITRSALAQMDIYCNEEAEEDLPERDRYYSEVANSAPAGTVQLPLQASGAAKLLMSFLVPFVAMTVTMLQPS